MYKRGTYYSDYTDEPIVKKQKACTSVKGLYIVLTTLAILHAERSVSKNLVLEVLETSERSCAFENAEKYLKKHRKRRKYDLKKLSQHEDNLCNKRTTPG